MSILRFALPASPGKFAWVTHFSDRYLSIHSGMWFLARPRDIRERYQSHTDATIHKTIAFLSAACSHVLFVLRRLQLTCCYVIYVLQPYIFVRANTRQFSIRSCPTEDWGSESSFWYSFHRWYHHGSMGKLGSLVPRLQSHTCSCVMGSWPLLPFILTFVLYVWYLMANIVTSVGTPKTMCI